MRALILLNSLASGGTERSTVELLPALIADGIEVMVATLRHTTSGFSDEVADIGADVQVLHGRSLSAQMLSLRRLIRSWRPDLVHTALFESDLVGRVAAAGGPPVLTSLVNDTYGRARRADARVAGWKLEATRIADAVSGRLLTAHFHAVSDSVKDAAVRDLAIDARRITVVSRSRDPRRLGSMNADRRTAVRSRLGVPHGHRVILAVGRLEYQKGHRHLFDALPLTADRSERTLLLIAGRDGAEAEPLRALILSHGLADRVRLLGHRDDVGDLLAAADVFAFPSLYEGCAGALLEACMAGLPVVASDLRPVRDLVRSRPSTVLVPPAAPNRLADGLDALLADPDAARARCRPSMSLYANAAAPDTVNRRMVQLYQDVAAAPKRTAYIVRQPMGT